jgi:flavin reductase (DIM6/NTAB) family NADH-FMN oxidoreductase RutF
LKEDEVLTSQTGNVSPISQPLIPSDPRDLRKALGQFATGVTVVSYYADGEARGATVNSFTGVSLDPPLILVSLARSARTSGALAHCSFVVNVLARDQLDLAMHFAGRPQSGLADPWLKSEKAPRLKGCVAYFECEPWRSVEAGDHIVFFGRVLEYHHENEPCLAFHQGQFRVLGEALNGLKAVVPLDGRPVLRWLEARHQLVDLAEEGVRLFASDDLLL